VTHPHLPTAQEYEQVAAEFMRRLRERRIEMDLSQAAVAAHLGDVAPSTVGFWENGGNIPFYRFLQYADLVRFNFGMEPYVEDVSRWVEELKITKRSMASVRAAARNAEQDAE
jgi:transcriptional regulator with XRE-family HTH domain